MFFNNLSFNFKTGSNFSGFKCKWFFQKSKFSNSFIVSKLLLELRHILIKKIIDLFFIRRSSIYHIQFYANRHILLLLQNPEQSVHSKTFFCRRSEQTDQYTCLQKKDSQCGGGNIFSGRCFK